MMRVRICESKKTPALYTGTKDLYTKSVRMKIQRMIATTGATPVL